MNWAGAAIFAKGAEPDPTPEGGWRVQGQRASDLEHLVYVNLLRLKWDDSQIIFQSDVLGGRSPGGQVLDFVLEGFGMTYVIDVRGEYWHSRDEQIRQQDLLDAARVNEIMPFAVFVVAWGSDLESEDEAYNFLMREVGRGGGGV